ncbi:60S ribosomal protein L38 [Hypoxylon texense]
MYFQTFIATTLLASGLAFAAPAGPAGIVSRQTYIGSVEFTSVDGTTVHSNMQIGAGYRQLTQPGELQVMTQLIGLSDNLVCSSQSNDGKTTTVTGIQTSSIDPPRQQVVVKCDFIDGPPTV